MPELPITEQLELRIIEVIKEITHIHEEMCKTNSLMDIKFAEISGCLIMAKYKLTHALQHCSDEIKE